MSFHVCVTGGVDIKDGALSGMSELKEFRCAAVLLLLFLPRKWFSGPPTFHDCFNVVVLCFPYFEKQKHVLAQTCPKCVWGPLGSMPHLLLGTISDSFRQTKRRPQIVIVKSYKIRYITLFLMVS